MSMAPIRNGFTLVEVLVALVVSAMMIAIIMDGAVTAKSRSHNSENQIDALLSAQSHIETLRGQPGEPTRLSGEDGEILWSLVEQEIVRDPRGAFSLVEAQISAGPEDRRNLVFLQKRYLKKIAAP